jgi:uncharacterized membrane protein YecN with MAPEG domain
MSNAHLAVTGLYAGLLGLIMLILSTLVSGVRMKVRSSIGITDSPELLEAIRRHGNFVEWVPFVLLLMAIAEIDGFNTIGLHVVGCLLLVSRVLHPLGIRHNVMPQPLRAAGAVTTFLLALFLSGVVIWQFVAASNLSIH